MDFTPETLFGGGGGGGGIQDARTKKTYVVNVRLAEELPDAERIQVLPVDAQEVRDVSAVFPKAVGSGKNRERGDGYSGKMLSQRNAFRSYAFRVGGL